MTTPAKGKDTSDKDTERSGGQGIAAGELDSNARSSDPANPDDALVVSNREIQAMGVHYARSGQIRQALGELRNARALGNRERERSARKTLEAQGFDLDAHERGHHQSTGGDKPVDARRQPPEGRSATPPGTVHTQAPTTPTASGPSAGTGTSTQATPAKATPAASPAPATGPPGTATPGTGVSAKTDPPTKGK
jgi:TolA-binding protein